MTQLLIHSMRELGTITLPVLDAAGARRVAEIGAEHGGNTELLLRWADARDGELVSIDPAPGPGFADWAGAQPRLQWIADTSLAAIERLGGIDAWVIDGDHNWYTVYHELQAIRRVCRREGRPMLVLMHDVSWPMARRDLYYAPDRIPAPYRHPYSYEVGVTLDSADALAHQGFRGLGAFAWALHEGGPRNGVLTAVEDFVADAHEAGEPFAWARVPAVFGLGVLFDLHAPWAAAVAQVLAPWHEHPLLKSLEENRLRNYLAVIAWQDRPRAVA